jgi:hypothetical protein
MIDQKKYPALQGILAAATKPKNLKELDAWIAANPRKDHSLMSRYQALKHIYGERQADQIMRKLEVNSWDLRIK